MLKLKGKKLLSLLLAIAFLLSLCGCTASGIGDVIEGAGELIEIVDEITEQTAEKPDVSQDELILLPPEETAQPEETAKPEEQKIDENGSYDSKEEVALYIHIYGHLPSNYVSKSEAKAEGWNGGSVEKYLPGCCIGGDSFGNYEGILPKKKGRKYTECDIDTLGENSRGAKRIIFSNDGLVYYTDDHYESFELLYGEE